MATYSRSRDEEGPSTNRPIPKRTRTAAAALLRIRGTDISPSPSPSPSAASAANSGDRGGAYNSSRSPSYGFRDRGGSSWGREPRQGEASAAHSEDESRQEPASPSYYDDGDNYEEENYDDDYDEEEERNRRSVDERGANWSPGGNSETARPVSVTLMDPDVLDCPICLEPLNWPVYQCDNGHIACESCCAKMRKKCGSCCLPIGLNRCRALEKVIESLRISCRYTQYGCKDLINYCEKYTHEKSCKYTPCYCPHLGCNYVNLPESVHFHFASQHRSTSTEFEFDYQFSVSLGEGQEHIFLQEEDTKEIFVLTRFIENAGSYVSVTFIAPISSANEYFYKLTAEDIDGVRSIVVTTGAEWTARWSAEDTAKRVVVVPNEFLTSTGRLKLDLTIWRDRASERRFEF